MRTKSIIFALFVALFFVAAGPGFAKQDGPDTFFDISYQISVAKGGGEHRGHVTVLKISNQLDSDGNPIPPVEIEPELIVGDGEGAVTVVVNELSYDSNGDVISSREIHIDAKCDSNEPGTSCAIIGTGVIRAFYGIDD